MAEKTIREERLPDEIIETQKARSSLLQWKLIISSALGAAGLGLTNEDNSCKIGLLALIPLACAYVDLLCTNLNLRIILIGKYFADVRKDAYEIAARKAAERLGWFDLEDWALYWSTYIAAAVLACLAIMKLLELHQSSSVSSWLDFTQCYAILCSCIVGPVLTRITEKSARKRTNPQEQFNALHP